MKFTFAPESRPLAGYTLKRAIYRGGFGEVYYGISDAGREVALKLLQQNTEVELRGIQQCLNLSHPNLVTIFDIKRDADGDHWVIMEFVAGETLESIIRRYPNGMPVELILKWLPGMIAGVGFLHRSGLVHRDLKPANIFVENTTVKVGDVGLTKFIRPSRHSAHTQSVGTVYYMAPEVAKGRYGKAVDLYALGVILYEMLTGQLPFDGESTGEILMKHLTEKPELSRLPPRLRPVIAKALEKNPDERFDHPETLLAAVEEAITGKTPPGAGETLPVSAEKGKDKHSQRQKKQKSWCGWSKSRHHPLMVLAFVGFFVFASRAFHEGPLHHRTPSFAMITLLGIVIATMLLTQKRRKRAASRLELENLSTQQYTPPAVRASPVSHPDLGAACASSLLAIPLVGMLSGLMLALRPSMFSLDGDTQINAGLSGLFLFVSLLSTWAILLVPAILPSDAKGRVSRWSYGLIGSLVGASAWKIKTTLFATMPKLPDWKPDAMFEELWGTNLLLPERQPAFLGFVVFFLAFFAMRNWNRLTAATRTHRFSVWSVVASITLGWLTTKIFLFPTPWAMAWAGVIACSVQLASPWDPTPRPRFIAHENHSI